MSIASFFADLGVAVKGHEWPLGGISNIDGSVYLLVWKSEIKKRDSHTWAYLGETDVKEKQSSAIRQRDSHIRLLKSGRRGFLLFGQPVVNLSGKREVGAFDAERIFPVGDIVTRDGGIWAQFLTGIPVRQFF